MTREELAGKTVLELRTIARENHVKLSAGIDKAGIVDRIAEAICQEQDEPPAAEPVRETPVPAYEAPRPADPVEPPKPKYTLAYQAQPQYSRQPAYQARPAYDNRRPGADPLRPGPVQRPVSYSRFGPGARQEPATPAYQAPAERARWGEDAPRPAPQQRVMREEYQAPRREPNPMTDRNPVTPLSLQEAINPAELRDGSGILDLHLTDGYGFLRGTNLQSNSRDIYVSAAQVRRFGLRAGDVVSGKVRPQRDGDRYAAMLYVTGVNGKPTEEAASRPLFDELTARYPERRMDLGGAADVDVRLIDLLCPVGYGTRGLICTPPGGQIGNLLIHLAAGVRKAAPDAEVAILVVGETPEETALLRSAADCPVYSVGFEQTPEASFRTCDLALEHAMRGCELGRNEVLIVASLTRISKLGVGVAASNPQQRPVAGPVNPTGLYRAKRIFSSARSLEEGGSLTVLGVCELEPGNKVDEAVASEFRGAANMTLTLSADMEAAEMPVDLANTATKQQAIMVGAERDADLVLTRRLVSGGDPVQSINHLADLIRKTESNDVFLARVRSWAVTARKDK